MLRYSKQKDSILVVVVLVVAMAVLEQGIGGVWRCARGQRSP
jgi:hypothetical protein